MTTRPVLIIPNGKNACLRSNISIKGFSHAKKLIVFSLKLGGGNPQLLSPDMQKANHFFVVESNKTLRRIKKAVLLLLGRLLRLLHPLRFGKKKKNKKQTV